jgi:hypothetical protein
MLMRARLPHPFDHRDSHCYQKSLRPRNVGDARIVDSNWINVNLIRRWIRSYQHSHGRRCSVSVAALHFSASAGPTWLIDTCNQCIVPASSDTYIAFRYAWGGGEHNLTTQRENIKGLTRFNALLDEIHRRRIPNTVKDAIALTETLGERYL